MGILHKIAHKRKIKYIILHIAFIRCPSDSKKKLSGSTISLFRKLIEYYSLFYEGLFKQDIKKLQQVTESRKELHFGECYKALKKSRGDDAIAISYIREISRIVQLSVSPVISKLL
jgi:wobble nucleotide-excising tRNase